MTRPVPGHEPQLKRPEWSKHDGGPPLIEAVRQLKAAE
jgi:hypothetical protein